MHWRGADDAGMKQTGASLSGTLKCEAGTGSFELRAVDVYKHVGAKMVSGGKLPPLFAQRGAIVGEDGLDFNIDGMFLLQKMQFRMKESNWWMGGSYLYSSAENTFDLNSDLPIELPKPTFEFDLGAVSLFVQYDGRNSTFTPSEGISAYDLCFEA